jgi:hypothetical protein
MRLRILNSSKKQIHLVVQSPSNHLQSAASRIHRPSLHLRYHVGPLSGLMGNHTVNMQKMSRSSLVKNDIISTISKSSN